MRRPRPAASSRAIHINDGNSFSTIGNGGDPEYALEEITGASAITDFDGTARRGANMSTTTPCRCSRDRIRINNRIGAGSPAGRPRTRRRRRVGISSTSATDSSGYTTLVADHAMSIYGYDSATGELEIRNPWGTESGQSWDTTFEVSLAHASGGWRYHQRRQYGRDAPSVVIGALVSAAAGLQASATVTAFYDLGYGRQCRRGVRQPGRRYQS